MLRKPIESDIDSRGVLCGESVDMITPPVDLTPRSEGLHSSVASSFLVDNEQWIIVLVMSDVGLGRIGW